MSKKLISLLLSICMLFCLFACGKTETSNNSTYTPSETQADTTQDIDESGVKILRVWCSSRVAIADAQMAFSLCVFTPFILWKTPFFPKPSKTPPFE